MNRAEVIRAKHRGHRAKSLRLGPLATARGQAGQVCERRVTIGGQLLTR